MVQNDNTTAHKTVNVNMSLNAKNDKLDYIVKPSALHISLLKNEKASHQLVKTFAVHITVKGPMYVLNILKTCKF